MSLVNAAAQLDIILIRAAIAVTANQQADTGIAVDELEGPAAVELSLGAVTGTTPTNDVKLQHSDASGSGFVDVPGGAFTQLATADAGSVKKKVVDARALKKFLRIHQTVGGTTPSFLIGCNIIGRKKYR